MEKNARPFLYEVAIEVHTGTTGLYASSPVLRAIVFDVDPDDGFRSVRDIIEVGSFPSIKAVTKAFMTSGGLDMRLFDLTEIKVHVPEGCSILRRRTLRGVLEAVVAHQMAALLSYIDSTAVATT